MKLSWWLCRPLLVIAAAASCGPPLTDPASLDITGRWRTTDAIGPLSAVDMNITQRRDGTVSGEWTAKVFPPNPPCPPELGNPTGPVIGTHTVLEVRLAFLGAGDFDGQAIDRKMLRGSFSSCDKTYAVIFLFAGPLPRP